MNTEHVRYSVDAFTQSASGFKGYADTERGNAAGTMNAHMAGREWWQDVAQVDDEDEMFINKRNWDNSADTGDAYGNASTKVVGIVNDTIGGVRSVLRA